MRERERETREEKNRICTFSFLNCVHSENIDKKERFLWNEKGRVLVCEYVRERERRGEAGVVSRKEEVGRGRTKKHKIVFFFPLSSVLSSSSSFCLHFSLPLSSSKEPWTRTHAWRCSPASWAPERGKVSEVERLPSRRECISHSFFFVRSGVPPGESEREGRVANSHALVSRPCFLFVPLVVSSSPRVHGCSLTFSRCRVV